MLSCLFSLLVVLGFSCKKQLDLYPTDSIDATKAFRSLADINLGIIGAYAVLGTSHISNTSLVSDECMLPSENSTGGGVATHRWQYDGSNGTITGAFSENYIGIDRVNRVLAALDIVPSSAAETEVKERYRGELLALRAYCHFELLRNFASRYEPGALGIAYMEESKTGLPSRLTFEASIAKIKGDLTAAKSLLPASFADRSRITRTAIPAMQARVALYERNWVDAITYATEAINLLPLATKTQFPDIWKDRSEAEVYWKLKRASTADGLLGAFYFNTNNTVLYAPSMKLMNLFDKTNDIRFNAYIKIDNTRGTGKTPNIVVKYVGGTTTVNLADVKLYRTGEMYLVRSEAYTETAKLAEAAADLNELRAARINGYNNQTFSGAPELIDVIYNERFKELAFEGHRFFDLRRRNLNVVREPADAINALGAVLLTPAQAQYTFPLPDAEIKANRNMQQNPLY
ncbi:RagB/SusD family nutrient uptake outer membrane protein [Segetibacter sp. 3557_3]|uniref:RagB/SusD family nutrient uptake outer membrane protein n=1 Tax=Segetibacter sp. 3557_3 TaxID=2547429 RepID=UPI0010583D36|nr:RagB/SusD family nutrient uptake outer membrane protein [Segetibacter sp. 3557_3]TDH24184.1 RagB/SusD family nutrient uptake outer membrane protein [Segetibacter sp. 3557_3]